MLIFCASTAIVSLVVGTAMLKSANSSDPCLNIKKNPVLVLPGPVPSLRYTNPNWLPGVGGSSYNSSWPLNAVETISNVIPRDATVLENVNNGTSVPVVLNLYCSVGMPWIVPDP